MVENKSRQNHVHLYQNYPQWLTCTANTYTKAAEMIYRRLCRKTDVIDDVFSGWLAIYRGNASARCPTAAYDCAIRVFDTYRIYYSRGYLSYNDPLEPIHWLLNIRDVCLFFKKRHIIPSFPFRKIRNYEIKRFRKRPWCLHTLLSIQRYLYRIFCSFLIWRF